MKNIFIRTYILMLIFIISCVPNQNKKKDSRFEELNFNTTIILTQSLQLDKFSEFVEINTPIESQNCQKKYVCIPQSNFLNFIRIDLFKPDTILLKCKANSLPVFGFVGKSTIKKRIQDIKDSYKDVTLDPDLTKKSDKQLDYTDLIKYISSINNNISEIFIFITDGDKNSPKRNILNISGFSNLDSLKTAIADSVGKTNKRSIIIIAVCKSIINRDVKISHKEIQNDNKSFDGHVNPHKNKLFTLISDNVTIKLGENYNLLTNIKDPINSVYPISFSVNNMKSDSIFNSISAGGVKSYKIIASNDYTSREFTINVNYIILSLDQTKKGFVWDRLPYGTYNLEIRKDCRTCESLFHKDNLQNNYFNFDNQSFKEFYDKLENDLKFSSFFVRVGWKYNNNDYDLSWSIPVKFGISPCNNLNDLIIEKY